jgi:hypothetical protein
VRCPVRNTQLARLFRVTSALNACRTARLALACRLLPNRLHPLNRATRQPRPMRHGAVPSAAPHDRRPDPHGASACGGLSALRFVMTGHSYSDHVVASVMLPHVARSVCLRISFLRLHAGEAHGQLAGVDRTPRARPAQGRAPPGTARARPARRRRPSRGHTPPPHRAATGRGRSELNIRIHALVLHGGSRKRAPTSCASIPRDASRATRGPPSSPPSNGASSACSKSGLSSGCRRAGARVSWQPLPRHFLRG